MNQNTNQKTPSRITIEIPTLASNQTLFQPNHYNNHTIPRMYQTPGKSPSHTHCDIPESSNAKSQTTIPKFSYYSEHIIEEGLKACQGSILGKIITDKPIHVSSIQNGLENIWGSPFGLKIQEIEGKILQFFMDKSIDQDRILQGNPWIFRNSWLIVKPWDRETDPKIIDFDHAPIWIQLWGLPHHCKTKAMGAHLGSLMGDVEASEIYEYPGKKIIVKIKVAINVHQPIPTGIHVGNLTDGTCWVDFRYEKLPQVCFNCGLIGHAMNLCRNTGLKDETLAPLGPWIRSTQYGRRKMADQDKKFYSNPSHSPNFGTYSPTVPESLLAQMAAMKVQQQTSNEQNYEPQQQDYNMKHQQPKEAAIAKDRQAQNMGSHQAENQIEGGSNTITGITQAQAKRLKISNTSNNSGRDDMDIQQLAGPGPRASHQI